MTIVPHHGFAFKGSIRIFILEAKINETYERLPMRDESVALSMVEQKALRTHTGVVR